MSNARDKANIPALNFSSTGIDDNATSTAITIDSSERVGIGTTSPSSYYANDLVVDTGSAIQSGITIVADSSSDPMFAFADGTSGSERYSGYISYNHSTNAMSFGVNSGSEAMRINSSRNVGIGTTSPGHKLEVSGDVKANNFTNRTSLQGVDATPDDANNFELGAGYLNLYRDSTAEVNQIQFGKNGTLAAAFSTGANYLAIKTNGNNERMRIDSSGNLLINTTVSPSSHTNSLVIGNNVSNPNIGGIFGHQMINKSFRTTTVDNTNFDITLTASSNLVGCFTVSVFGGYGNSNREGYAEYRVYCNRETNSIRTITVQSPVNENGAFTSSYSFSATKPNNSSIKFAITKGTGAHYWMIIKGELNDNRFTGATKSES
jgi:hypothetical protein